MTTHNNEHKHEAQDIIEEYELGLVEAGLKVNVDIDYDKLAEARQLVWERLEAYIQSQIEEARIDELETMLKPQDCYRPFCKQEHSLVKKSYVKERIAQLKASKKGLKDE